jgi:hypothetical protein
MAKKKPFVIEHDYLANYGGKDRSSLTKTSVNISNFTKLKKQIENYIAEDNDIDLQKLLHSEFINPEVISTYTETPYNTFSNNKWDVYHIGSELVCALNPKYGTGQRDTYTYEEHYVAPLIEELLINHKEDFNKLLGSASDKCTMVLMNFTGLDLTGFDVSDLDTTQANFTASMLQNSKGVTQDLLDRSLTYKDAVLPEGIIPFWTKTKKETVLNDIEKLKQYGTLLLKSCDAEGVSKGQKAVALADSLTTMITSTTQHNGAFQEAFLEKLHEHDEAFSHRRYYGLKMLISNIALCAVGLGIGYLAIGLINYAETGRFFFFSQPETEQMVETIDVAAAHAP